MPPDFSISLGVKGGTDQQLLHPGTERIQSMRGFEDTYTDIIDYIVRITHRIWEEKDIGYIYDTYKHNSRVHDDFGLQYGRDKIVADTVHTINAFPDIRLFADEIVWAGDDEVGFHTSHRTVITGTNTGPSKFGPPTGKKIRVLVIANCIALQNEIFEEWVIYDHCDLIRQLGFDVRETARHMASITPAPALGDKRFGENERLPGQGKPVHMDAAKGLNASGSAGGTSSFDVEGFIKHMYHYTWNWRNLSTINKSYTPNIMFHGTNHREYYGIGALHSYILSILAMFPDAFMQIDDIYWMGNDKEGYLVSVRWSLTGTHKGHGLYGEPTGKPVRMWGISQHHIKSGRIVEEWTLFNELGVLMQILGE